MRESSAIRGSPQLLPALRFVRRDDSERWCDAAIAASSDGRPRVALVVGEAGVGKTRLLRELGARAAARGFAVHVGRGAEESSLPFMPFRHALSARLARKPRQRGGQLGLDAHILRWLVKGEAPRSLRRASVKLLSDSTPLASAVARAGPMLLVIDDLHWADHPSLEAFEVLAFALADAETTGDSVPFLLAGSLRPPEPAQRLARVLARLQQESACQVLQLAGFNEDEISEFLSALGVGPATHQMVAMLREVTGGNPLFVQEVVRHLQQTGAVRRHGRFFSIASAAIEIPMPTDVRAALANRTDRLDTPAREALTLGAVVGDPFDLGTLATIAKIGRPALDAMLDSWIAASLVVSDGTRVSFAHPLVRQGLLAELPSSRRQRLHAEVADGLLALSLHPDDDRRLEIAHHLVAAGPAAEPARLLAECSRAGDLAAKRDAWTSAARFYATALAAADRDASLLSERGRGDLHFRAGYACYRDQDPGPCLAHFEAAIAAARAAGDLAGLVRALLGRIRACFTLVSVSYGARIDTDDLETVVERIAADEPLLAAFAWSEIAQVLWTAKRPREARGFAERALAVGTSLKAPMLAAEAHRALSLICAQELDPQAALEHLEAGLTWARRGRESWIESQVLQRMILPLLWLGKTDRVESVSVAAASSTQLIHDWGDHSLAHGGMVCWAVARADFEGAERHAREVLRLMRRTGYPWAGPTALPAVALSRALRGSWPEADEALALLAEPGGVFEEPGPDIIGMSFLLREVLTALRSPDDRPAVVDRLRLLVPRLARDARGDLYGLGLAAAVVDCAALADSREIAGVAQDLLAEAHDRHVVLTTGWVSLVTRSLGVASACLGHTDAAARWFEGALASSREIGARAEHLQTMVAFARMLLREGGPGNTRRALELLALAVPQLRDLGMSPLLAAATQLARLGKPSPVVRAARGRRAATTAPGENGPLLAIMFTDISGSSAMYERLGDTAGLALVRVHDGVVRDWLARCDGTMMKHTGDGVEAAFRSVPSAIDCAVAIQRALARHTRRHPDRPLRVRIGINVGEPLAESGDLFGSAVNIAARVCARAKGGEILVTQAVRQLADGHDTRFRARGIATLRGVRSRVHLFAVVW